MANFLRQLRCLRARLLNLAPLLYAFSMAGLNRQQVKMVESEVDRISDLLQGYMRFKNMTVRDVERELGWGRGTLNRLFNGRSELKMRHVLEVAACLGLTPEQFFLMAYKQMPEGTTTLERVLATLEMLGERVVPAAKKERPAPQVSLDDLQPLMEEMMRRMLAERGMDEPGARTVRSPRRRKAG